MDKVKLESLSEKIINISSLIEIARDASYWKDDYAQAYILDIALNEQFDVHEEIESMY